MKHRLEDLGAIVERLQNDLADLRQEMEFHRPDVHAPQAIGWREIDGVSVFYAYVYRDSTVTFVRFAEVERVEEDGGIFWTIRFSEYPSRGCWAFTPGCPKTWTDAQERVHEVWRQHRAR